MKNAIETLEQAIEAGLKIKAVYYPNGEVVKCDFEAHNNTTVTCEFQDGTIEEVSVGDLIDHSWN